MHNGTKPGDVLLEEPPIEAELFPQLVRNGSRNQGRKKDSGRITRQDASKEKHERHKTEQERDGLKEPVYQET
jgi:hypothetical protein